MTRRGVELAKRAGATYYFVSRQTRIETMLPDYTLIFLLLIAVVIGFFPILDAVRMWRMAKHYSVEQRREHIRNRRLWRRRFIWSVFSTKRVPRLTDQSDQSGLRRQG